MCTRCDECIVHHTSNKYKDMKNIIHLTSGTVDLEKRVFTTENEEESLTEQENQLLAYFIENTERIISKEELLLEVWQTRKSTKSRIVSQAVKQLRKKIGDSASSPTMLFSVYGQGYRFVLPEQPKPEVPSNLPVSLAPFFGRSVELQYCLDFFAQKERMLTILGTGGMGKTSLAMKYADLRRKANEYLGGIYFFDLSDARTQEDIVRIVSQSLNFTLPPHTSPIDAIASHIQSCGLCLLVFDNFEQITQYAQSTISQWYHQSAEAHFIITSRQRLGVTMEEVYDLPPFIDEEAVQFFIAYQTRMGLKESPSTEEQVLIAEIVQKLDGIPLAIQLAASKTRLLSLKQIYARLQDRFRLLRVSNTSSDRQGTMRAAIDWSWNLLDTVEKSILMQSTVFRGGFDIDAAEYILTLPADVPKFIDDVLQQLIDKSMLVLSRGTEKNRITMYESIRHYVEEKRTENIKRDTQRKHREYYFQYLQDNRHVQQAQLIEVMEPETSNIEQAWKLFLDADIHKSAQILIDLSALYETKGLYASMRHMIEEVFQVGEMETLPSLLFFRYGRLLWRLQQFDVLEEFLDRLPDQKDHTRYDLSNLKIHLLLRNNRLKEAEDLIHEEMKHQKEIDKASSFLLLSNLYARQNSNTKGLHTTKNAYQIYCKHEIEHAKTQVMGNLGADWINHGDLEQARILLTNAARRNQKDKNKFGYSLNCINLSHVSLLEHDPDDAYQYASTAVSMLNELQMSDYLRYAFFFQGISIVMRGSNEEGVAVLRKAQEDGTDEHLHATIELLCLIANQGKISSWKQYSSLIMDTSSISPEDWEVIHSLAQLSREIQVLRKNEEQREIRSAEVNMVRKLRNPSLSIPRKVQESIPDGNMMHRYCILLIEHNIGARYIKRFQRS